jgi:hypothetical protein
MQDTGAKPLDETQRFAIRTNTPVGYEFRCRLCWLV